MKKLPQSLIFIILFLGVNSCIAANVSWLEQSGGNGSATAVKICNTLNNEIIISGTFTGEAVFGNDTLQSQNGSSDIFIVKYNINHNVLWTAVIGNSCNDKLGGIAVDASGTIFLSGTFHNFLFVQGSGIMATGGTDVFIAALDNNGNLSWINSYGGPGTDAAGAIVVNAAGEVYAAAVMEGTTFPLSDQAATGICAAVAKLSALGELLWSVAVNADVQSQVTIESISTDSYGKLFLTGGFYV
jgi:hypothetical protein